MIILTFSVVLSLKFGCCRGL